MGARLGRLLAGAGVLLGLGLGYAALGTATGWFLPCPFRAVTGLLCPGCGVTHMCLALLRLDLAGAWASSPGVLLLLPSLALLGGRLAARYVRTGQAVPRGWEQPLLWGMVLWLAVWGVGRNLL